MTKGNIFFMQSRNFATNISYFSQKFIYFKNLSIPTHGEYKFSLCYRQIHMAAEQGVQKSVRGNNTCIKKTYAYINNIYSRIETADKWTTGAHG